MSPDPPVGSMANCGLIWGFDFLDGQWRPIDDVELLRERRRPPGFRWLHLNLADQRAQRWLASAQILPPRVRGLLTSADVGERVAIEDEMVGFVLQDIERDFDGGETRVGVVRLAVGASLMITARLHPLHSADVVRQRILAGAPVADQAAALELMLGAMGEVVRRIVAEMDDTVQAVEDELIRDGKAPTTRTFISVRSLMARLHRMLTGMRALFHRLRDLEGFPAALAGPVDRAADRLSALDAELLSIQGQLRLLREELDLQATQRTNQNLYILSILTALMMPATLVTGLFGMNTGGLPLAHGPMGSFMAAVLAVGASLAVYVGLRLMGFIRR